MYRFYGITPAYAGNTFRVHTDSLFLWDHPRIRGEYANEYYGMAEVTGSPPHTRGILFYRQPTSDSVRITPAYAGNTVIECWTMDWIWDHPRIRGEYQ